MKSPRFHTLDEWLTWLESLHPTEIELGLARVAEVAGRLKLNFQSTRIVTVAGTNGKGSCVAALAALLRASDKRVGCYTSPHIQFYNERVEIDGVMLGDDALIEAFAAVDEARADVSLTYFEFGTLAALYAFGQAKLDYIVLEVGLGGRLDAVNVVDPDLAILTSIALDHEAWLGSDREQIGREKAGILRAGVPFICVDDSPPESVLHAAESLMTQSYYINEDFYWRREDAGLTLSVPGQGGLAQRYRIEHAALPAPSLLAASQAWHLLEGARGATPVDIASVLSGLSLPGRMEHRTVRGQRLILDVAHNPQAAEYLAQALQSTVETPVVFVWAMMSDKDCQAVVSHLSSVVGHWVCTEVADMPRCRRATELGEVLLGVSEDYTIKTDVHAALLCALDKAKAIPGEPPVVVAGSFYLIAEAKRCLDSLEESR